MDNLTLKKFAELVNGELFPPSIQDQPVTNLSIHSRSIQTNGVFFPLKGANADGHDFIQEAVKNGAVAVVVGRERAGELCSPPGLPLVIVKDSLEALHKIAGWWRAKFTGKVIAITGSNGKTVVQDALVRLLSTKNVCVGSRDSLTSQIGIPPAITRMPLDSDYAVIDVRISDAEDMMPLREMIRPDFGILTDVDLADIAACIGDRDALAQEQVKLFRNLPREGWLLTSGSNPYSERALESLTFRCEIRRVGDSALPSLEVRRVTREGSIIVVRFPPNLSTNELSISTHSREILSNIELAISAAYLLGVNPTSIEKSLSGYAPVPTRMEIWRSPTGITIINDTNSADPVSIKASLETLSALSNGGRSFFALGDLEGFRALGSEEQFHIGKTAAESGVYKLILTGDQYATIIAEAFKQNRRGTENDGGGVIQTTILSEAKEHLLSELKRGDILLAKCRPHMGIARVVNDLMGGMSPTRYYIDLRAIGNNLLQFNRLMGSKARILAMVKALAYGSDATRLSLELQRMNVEDFGVASVDEGIDLRKAGVTGNIVVMICSPDETEKLVAHELVAIVYSHEIVRPLAEAARSQGKIVAVHVKVDTGMGRLGVKPEEVGELIRRIAAEPLLRIVGLMTHFACADDPSKDEFTKNQIELFESTRKLLSDEFGLSNLLFHAAATSGAVRFPEARYDLVRIGLGMYGIYPSKAVEEEIKLDPAISLISKIIEVKVLRRGDFVGYGAEYRVETDHQRIGLVPLGYHDGVPRTLSNKGKVLIDGTTAPILGRVSMDSLVVDLSQHPHIEEGADVLIYGKYAGYELRAEEVASDAGTIPYELLARLGPRVQRIYLC